MAVNRVIARLTVECTSPLAIGTGDDDPLYDLMLARDPNGLPMLPATSIAGALRARLTVEDARKWLGSEASDTPARSLVDITDGLVHWSDNKPRDGRVDHDSMTGEFCQMLLGKVPVERDHVRLDHRGVVDGDGKFTRSAVPTGTRFTFELRSTDDRPPATLRAAVARLAGALLGSWRSLSICCTATLQAARSIGPGQSGPVGPAGSAGAAPASGVSVSLKRDESPLAAGASGVPAAGASGAGGAAAAAGAAASGFASSEGAAGPPGAGAATGPSTGFAPSGAAGPVPP